MLTARGRADRSDDRAACAVEVAARRCGRRRCPEHFQILHRGAVLRVGTLTHRRLTGPLAHRREDLVVAVAPHPPGGRRHLHTVWMLTGTAREKFIFAADFLVLLRRLDT